MASPMRASDADRDATVRRLREHLVTGRLTLDEFTERMGRAVEARTVADLVPLESDLPSSTAPHGPSRRRPSRLTAAAFGHVKRTGRFRLARRGAVVSTFADVDLDLRAAELDAPTATLTALVLFGNLDVYVPEGTAVDVSGLTLFGHRREWGVDHARDGAAVVRLRVLSVVGTVDVWRVPHGATGGFSKLMAASKRAARALGAGEPPSGPALTA